MGVLPCLIKVIQLHYPPSGEGETVKIWYFSNITQRKKICKFWVFFCGAILAHFWQKYTNYETSFSFIHFVKESFCNQLILTGTSYNVEKRAMKTRYFMTPPQYLLRHILVILFDTKSSKALPLPTLGILS